MKPFRFLFVVLFALSLALALSSAAPLPAAHATNDVPDGLSSADWAAIQSFFPSDYIKASNTDADDEFGWSIAIDGDTLVVGAPSEGSNATGIDGDQTDNSAHQSGAVYVFTRTNGVWSQQSYLKASNTSNSQFEIRAAMLGGISASSRDLIINNQSVSQSGKTK